MRHDGETEIDVTSEFSRAELRCASCGYPRRGLADDTPCPECGAEWRPPAPAPVELRCSECGYPRRGLDDEAPCPECGAEWGLPVTASVRRSIPFRIKPKIDADGAMALSDRGCGFALGFAGIALALVAVAIYSEATRRANEPSVLVPFLGIGAVPALLALIHLFVHDRVRIAFDGVVTWRRRRFIISGLATCSIDQVGLRRCLVRKALTRGRAWRGIALGAGDHDIMLLAAEKSDADLEAYIRDLPETLRARLKPGWLRFEARPTPAVLW